MENEVNALKISMVKIETNLKNFEEKLSTHIVDQKITDKKVDDSFKEVITKIDHLGDTFQTRIGDKVDQKEVLAKFGDIEKTYVTKEAFSTVQKIVYGMAGAILLAFTYAIIEIAFKR